MHSLLKSQVLTNYLLHPWTFWSTFCSPFPLHLQSWTGCVTELVETAGIRSLRDISLRKAARSWGGALGQQQHESWLKHRLLCVPWERNSPYGNYTINHIPYNCLFESLSHYMWLPRHSSVAFFFFLSTQAHRCVTPPLYWTAVPSLAQFDHPLCKDTSQKGHLWTQVGGSDGPLLPAGRGAAWMSTAKHLFFHLQESWWQAAFRAVGERYKCIFSNYAIALSRLFSIWESRPNWHN